MKLSSWLPLIQDRTEDPVLLDHQMSQSRSCLCPWSGCHCLLLCLSQSQHDFHTWGFCRGYRIQNHYMPLDPGPTKSIKIFEMTLWRKASPLGTCTQVHWCWNPMVWNIHLLLEVLDASWQLIASDWIMMPIWLLCYLSYSSSHTAGLTEFCTYMFIPS